MYDNIDEQWLLFKQCFIIPKYNLHYQLDFGWLIDKKVEQPANCQYTLNNKFYSTYIHGAHKESLIDLFGKFDGLITFM